MAEYLRSWTDFLHSKDLQEDRGDIRAGGFAALPHLGLLAATGVDAESFLHSQLTSDVQGLAPGRLQLAGYCSPKGRLLATLIVWKRDDGLLLIAPRDLLPGLQKRLQMFVLRAKVVLTDVSDSQVIIGIATPGRISDDLTMNDGRLADWQAAVGLQRALWTGSADEAMTLWDALSHRIPPLSASQWRWLEIRAGLPMVSEATRDQFVPQMVNFDLIGGVNFRKGCYPGQEVVARSQYLGKLKRRMRLASTHAALASPGMEVFSAADPGQPCGMIVNAERNPEGWWDLLVEIKLEVAGMPVHLDAPDGALLQFEELPYPLRDPE